MPPTINRINRLVGTSLGRKMVAAITGVMLLGFLVAHLLGNLTMLQGPETMNGYAHWLQGHPLLWIARIGLLAVFVIHVLTTIRLANANRKARPVGYRANLVAERSGASRFMIWTGLAILAFVIYHLLHFTLGVVQPEHASYTDAQGRHDVYAMVVMSFRNGWVALSYVIAMVILWFHLIHGSASLFQTLGLSHEAYDPLLRGGAQLVSTLIVIGNIAIPTMIWLGWITIPT